MMRRSTRTAKKKINYATTIPRRKRVRVTVTVTARHYGRGGTMPNVYGDNILDPESGSRPFTITLADHDWDGEDAMVERGLGYAAVSTEHLDNLQKGGLMSEKMIRDIAFEQFKTMHAYDWRQTLAFDPHYKITVETINAEGVLKAGRAPMDVPMFSAEPMRLPFLRYVVEGQCLSAISAKDDRGREQCVPLAIFTWLSKVKDVKKMPKDLCAKYPTALPLVTNAYNHKVKPDVTIENVTLALDAIHARRYRDEVMDNGGHTCSDVDEFCYLCRSNMACLDRDGVVIMAAMDAKEKHHPLYFTCAHGHMYWHCDPKDMRCIAETIKQQRSLGSKHYLTNSLAVKEDKSERKLAIVTGEEMRPILVDGGITETTSFLVAGAKDVERLFYECGWLHGEPVGVVAREKRICRFSVKLPPNDTVVVIGADPFYEQMMRTATSDGGEFDHRKLFDACKAQNININPLDGLGKTSQLILHPKRMRITTELRTRIFEEQEGKCAVCGYAFDTAKCGHVDHCTPLGNGGRDEEANMQLLCEPCHLLKTEKERDIGFAPDLMHQSRINPALHDDTVFSPYFQCLEFCETFWQCEDLRVWVHDPTLGMQKPATISRIFEEDDKVRRVIRRKIKVAFDDDKEIVVEARNIEPVSLKDLVHHPKASEKFKRMVKNGGGRSPRLYKADCKGSRSYTMQYPRNVWPVFTALDDFEPFDGEVRDGGHYWVETHYASFPFHGTGWVRAALLQQELQKHEDVGKIAADFIKFQWIPTSTLPRDHFRPRVKRLQEAGGKYPELVKGLPLYDIGCMGRKSRNSSFVKCSLSKAEAAGKVVFDTTGFDADVREAHTLPDGRTIYTTTYSHECAQDTFPLPIYEQIKEEEAQTCADLGDIIEEQGGFLMGVATDAMLYCAMEGCGDIAPVSIQDENGNYLPLPGHFWDEEKTIPKWKFEEAKYSKAERDGSRRMDPKELPSLTRKWNVVRDDYIDPDTDRPVDHTPWSCTYARDESHGGLSVQGGAGTGKTHQVRAIIAEVKRAFPPLRGALEEEIGLVWKRTTQPPDGGREVDCEALHKHIEKVVAKHKTIGVIKLTRKQFENFHLDEIDETSFICVEDKVYKPVTHEEMASVVVTAPSNKAARIIGGMTIHKWFKRFDTRMAANGPGRVQLQREMMALRVFIVDEISQMHTWFWGKLCSLKEAFPHIRFFLVGDFNQLPPVCDVREGIDYRDNVALHYLVDGNRFDLKICRRADEDFFDLCNNLKTRLVHSDFPVTENTFYNLCYYNATRVRVNAVLQLQFIQGKEVAIRIAKCRRYPRSQDVTLCVGYPLRSRTNDGDQNKNEEWVVVTFDDETFTARRVPMEHEATVVQPTVQLEYKQFHHHFEPGFCATTHASQGDTLRCRYTIYDADRMTDELIYVAMTRASSRDLIQIDQENKNTFQTGTTLSVAGRTFEEAAEDVRFVKWVETREELRGELARFREFLHDRTTSHDDALEEEEEAAVVVQDVVREDVTMLSVVEGTEVPSGTFSCTPLYQNRDDEEEYEMEHNVRLRAAKERMLEKRQREAMHPPAPNKRPNISHLFRK